MSSFTEKDKIEVLKKLVEDSYNNLRAAKNMADDLKLDEWDDLTEAIAYTKKSLGEIERKTQTPTI